VGCGPDARIGAVASQPSVENKTAAFSGGARKHLRRAAMPVNAVQAAVFSHLSSPYDPGAVENTIATLT
jgi:hypothetical protein